MVPLSIILIYRLTQSSRSRHYLMLNVSETVRDTSTGTCPSQGCHFEWHWVIFSELAIYSMARSVARPLWCDSWACCSDLAHWWVNLCSCQVRLNESVCRACNHRCNDVSQLHRAMLCKKCMWPLGSAYTVCRCRPLIWQVQYWARMAQTDHVTLWSWPLTLEVMAPVDDVRRRSASVYQV